MPGVLDVAKYILNKTGSISTWKLQKLVYYSQAWNLVWNEAPIFKAKICAWANGPVCPELYHSHKGKYTISAATLKGGSVKNLSADHKDTIDKVIDYYNEFTGHQLSEITHQERPWIEARGNTPVGEPCSTEITRESMQLYYDSL